MRSLPSSKAAALLGAVLLVPSLASAQAPAQAGPTPLEP